MNKSQVSSGCTGFSVSLLSVLCLLAMCIVGLTGCEQPNASIRPAQTASPEAKDVIGLTETELRAKYPEITELDFSFDILVSKNLHPYHPPPTNKLLRFGHAYLVAELKDGRVIALHRVSG